MKRRVKIGAASSEDAFLIVPPHWPTFCLAKTNVGVWKKEHVKKSDEYDVATTDKDRRADNPGKSIKDKDQIANNLGIGIANKDGKTHNLDTDITDRNQRADNLGIGIADKNRGVDNLGIGMGATNGGVNNLGTRIVDRDEGANNPGIGINAANKGANNPGTNIADKNVNRRAENLDIKTPNVDKANDLSIDLNRWADGQVAASNKVYTSLFSLWKTYFILISFSELKTVFTSSFVSLSLSMTLIKQKVLFSKYPIVQIWIPSLNKTLLVMTSTLTPLKIFTRYFQSWVVSYIHLLLIILDRGLLRQE